MRERPPPPAPLIPSPPPNSYLAGGSGSGPAFALLFAPAILGSKFHFICHPVVVLKCRLGAYGASCKFKRGKIVALSNSLQLSICLLSIKLKLDDIVLM